MKEKEEEEEEVVKQQPDSPFSTNIYSKAVTKCKKPSKCGDPRATGSGPGPGAHSL